VEWKTIRIPAEDFEQHNMQRKELGITWAEYINGVSPTSSTQQSIEHLSDRVDEMALYLDEVRNRLEALR
jgi:hypothetical protein